MSRRAILWAMLVGVVAVTPVKAGGFHFNPFPNPSTLNNSSDVQVVVPPYITADGNVWAGSHPQAVHIIDHARAETMPDGSVWWVWRNLRRFDHGPQAPLQLHTPTHPTPFQLPQPPVVAQPPPTPFQLPQPPVVAQPPVQKVRPRFYYREFDGTKASFTSLGDGSWVNLANGNKYHFAQVGLDNDRVILRDKSRNLDVMLNADGTKFWSNGNGWVGLGQGIGTWGQ